MIAEIASLITSSKAAYDIAKGISVLKSEVERNEAISKILEMLLSLQVQALSVNAIAQELQKEKYDLEKKILEFKNWSETERKYELKEVRRGVFVFAYKEAMGSAEPMHWLCTNCWKDKIQSILQRISSADIYSCPKCKTNFDLSLDDIGGLPYADISPSIGEY